ncbi:reverse transcriptase domain-containing protein [Tanacetum coccineum]
MVDQRTMAELLQAPTEDLEGDPMLTFVGLTRLLPRYVRDVPNSQIKLTLLPFTMRRQPDLARKRTLPSLYSLLGKICFQVSTNAPSSSTSHFLEIAALADAVKAMLAQKSSHPASVKAVEEICVTYGGPILPQCLLPSNTVSNRRGDLKAITTRSGISYDGLPIPPPLSPLPKLVEREPEKLHEKDDNLASKFVDIFRELHFELSFADALLHMPKFASMFKSLLNKKEKLFNLAKTPVNENCSAFILKKLPRKLGDPDKFLIPCDFLELVECFALADLDASINLMPLFIWKKLLLAELTPTQMILELADRSTTSLSVVDYVIDPRVPLILRRPFLRMARTLINVYDEELTLRVDDEAITFKVGQTSRYSYNDAVSINQIDVIDVACEEYAQEVLGFLDRIDDADFDPEGDLLLLEKLLKTISSSPSFERTYGTDKLPVIIAKNLKEDEKDIFSLQLTRKTKRIPPSLALMGRLPTDACLSAYVMLWKKLTEAPILVTPDWDLPFEIMCDASDYAVGAVLGQPMMYAFEKFWPYLVLLKTIVYTDHSNLKYLLSKQDAKPRLILWILLLQGFDVIIRDKKGAENLVADYLSRLENPHQDVLENKEITETFPLESLGMVTFRGDSSTSWFADIANYHAGNFIVKGMSSQQKKKFFKDVKHYFWDDPYLFRIGAD